MMYDTFFFNEISYIHHCFYFKGFENNMILWKVWIKGFDFMQLDVIDEYIACV